ncbi:MAG TPA: CsbD family protein [Bryobacteraceae bacterium]|nr:CsbD family protein [Bryobacteraceae bacterium]
MKRYLKHGVGRSGVVGELLDWRLGRKSQTKPSTKDQIKGKLHAMKGKVKEKAGQVTDNPNLEAEGLAEQLAGKVQNKVGQIEKVLEK